MVFWKGAKKAKVAREMRYFFMLKL
jgi:hypothetical protein